MTLYRRRLPHQYETTHPVFLTWRLAGSLPKNRPFPSATLTSGESFAAMDRLLDNQQTGPYYLNQPAIADQVVEAIHHNADVLRHHTLHAFAVMPNHVHILLTPAVPLPSLIKSLRGITAKRANAILNRTGVSFRQEDFFDREVRNQKQFQRIQLYIEANAVRAGLAQEPNPYHWSSATRGPAPSIPPTGMSIIPPTPGI